MTGYLGPKLDEGPARSGFWRTIVPRSAVYIGLAGQCDRLQVLRRAEFDPEKVVVRALPGRNVHHLRVAGTEIVQGGRQKYVINLGPGPQFLPCLCVSPLPAVGVAGAAGRSRAVGLVNKFCGAHQP